jgi:hypothetical protein
VEAEWLQSDISIQGQSRTRVFWLQIEGENAER